MSKSHIPGIKTINLDSINWENEIAKCNRAIDFNSRKLTMVALCVGLPLGQKLNGRDFA